MDIDEKIAEFKASIESCERVCEAVPTGTIRDAALRKAEDCKQMVEWLEDYKRLSEMEEKMEYPNWISLTRIPMTEKERKRRKKMTDVTEEPTMILRPLPKDGEEVLISYGEYVGIDIFHENYDDGYCYFENTNINEIKAWCELPSPYRAESED